jgi:hypothetical protein
VARASAWRGVVTLALAFGAALIASQSLDDAFERCEAGYDLAIAVPPSMFVANVLLSLLQSLLIVIVYYSRRLCDLDACLCNAPWTGLNLNIGVFV